MKLLEKERQGAKVWKKYDSAKTPFQRILLSDHICQAKKESLAREYEALDPVDLLAQMEKYQDELWQHSWDKNSQAATELVVTTDDVREQPMVYSETPAIPSRYYRSSKKVNLRRLPRTWRTRVDPFERTWDEIRLRLELMPESAATALIQWLMVKYPGEYNVGHTRTLQRRIAQWRQEQCNMEEKMRALMIAETQCLLGHAVELSDTHLRSERHKKVGEVNRSLS